FTDADKIEHTEAAETLAALGVMTGSAQADGTTVFNPEGKLERSQMAKMIAVIMRGKDDIATIAGTTPTTSFADVKSGWYVPYINYCANLGYIKGYNDTAFGPNDEVKGVDAALMLLRAMGYELEGKGDYKLETAILAESVGLLTGLDELPVNEIINRDNVAQMIYNAINAPINNAKTTTVTTYTLTGKGKDGKDVKYDYFESSTDAYLYASMNEMTEVKVKKTSTAVQETLASKNMNTKTSLPTTVEGVTYTASNKTYTLGEYTTSVDLTKYMGQNVKFLYKDNANKTVLGVIPVGTVLYTGVYGDIAKDDTSKKILTIDGTQYGYTSNAIKTWNSAAAAEPNDWDELIVIDNNNDGKIDAMISRPVTVTKVGNVGKTSIVAGKTYTFKDNTIEDGLKQNDWVTIIDTLEKGSTIAKIATVENVQATAKSKDDVYTIGGSAYWSATDADELSGIQLGKSYNLVAINGAVFFADEYKDGSSTTAGIDKLVYALRVAAAKGGTDDMGRPTENYTQSVELLFTDGSKQIVTVDKVGGKAITAPEASEGDEDEDEAVAVTDGALYTYAYTEKTKTYQLTAAPTDNLGELAANASLSNTKLAGGKFGTTYINSDAILFVQLTNKDSEKEVKVLTGEEVAKWTTVTDNLAGGVLYTESKNGFAYTVAGMIILPNATKSWPGSISATKYGYITIEATSVYNSELKTSMAQLTIWNGTENKTYQYALGEGETLSDFAAGTLVSYTEGDKALASLEELSLTSDAVTGYAGGEDIIFETEKTVTSLKDAVIIFINDAKKEGVASSEASIQLAAEHTEVADLLIKNVYVGKDGDQVVLFVDSENKINDQTEVYTLTYELTGDATVTMNPANGKAAKGDKVEITVAAAEGATVEVKNGDADVTLTNGKGEVTLDKNIKLTITVTAKAAEGGEEETNN
ncbi:MAG: S-layer homology domain-containing protein, partial [Muribaculaceae bacterium]|nr:S-layer homology domain-containing protein [Muribaculaceae bacterium]